MLLVLHIATHETCDGRFPIHSNDSGVSRLLLRLLIGDGLNLLLNDLYSV